MGVDEANKCLDDIEARFGIQQQDIVNLHEELRFLSWSELREMEGSGVTIGSHTHSHLGVSGLDIGEKLRELRGSQALIRANVSDTAGDYLSYPDGRHDEEYELIARDLYHAAFGVRARTSWSNRYAIPRYSVSRACCRELSGVYQFYRYGVRAAKRLMRIHNES
jgi:peptidoglycan/xylan/chitin deacetylase (PgdA/CDA1 family)